MSNSLLKPSSAWFLRPPHIKQDVVHQRTTFPPQTSIVPSILLPEEEYAIRKLCPVTLNHLLPDLQFNSKEFLADALVEYDANLRTKFEKHLKNSHQAISGSSTESENESSEEEQDDVDIRIENDLSSMEPKKQNSIIRMKVLHPNKVNYPQENMKLLLPDVKLNNRRSSSPVLTKNFCTGCMNRGMALEKEYSKNKIQINQFNTMPSKDVGFLKFPPTVISDNIHVNDIKCNFRKSVLCDSSADIIEHYKEGRKFMENNQGMGLKSENDTLRRPHAYCHINNHFNCPTSCPSEIQQTTLPVPTIRRSRSVSPLKPTNFWPDPENSGLYPPSPYMIELARLRKEKLRIEERLLLRRRQVQELERLRPPVDKWYEMKDERFHREAHKNNIYVKNEKILPLIENRRRLIYETIRA